MKTRTIATLTALTLSALTGFSAYAADAGVTVAQPVDGIEVIVVRAKRPETLITDEIEVIRVTATRADQLAAIRELAREAMAARMTIRPRNGDSVPRGAYRNWAGNWAGMPSR